VRFRVHVDGEDHSVVASTDGGLVVDSDGFQTKVARTAVDRRLVQVGDRSYEVRIVEQGVDDGSFVLELGGELVHVSVADISRERTLGQSAGSSAKPSASPDATSNASARGTVGPRDQIDAPMSGRIVDIMVAVGDSVEQGDAVLVIEAMKMENELHAPRRGTVAAVLVKKGDPVQGGQALLVLE
jgi:biotin carboxyl carrier protein